MSATDELRRLLDECGVPWKDYGYENHTWWGEWHAENRASVNGLYVKVEAVITPEQAIDATLGRGTCHFEQIPEALYDDIECSECGVALWGFQMDIAGEGCPTKPRYCPNCGRRVEP